ncbi:MAG: MCP four helix bundle domain-containing protein [Rubrivivax sp.]|nr:MCP four helix bundle domain-containing protein [Rubrivivax sp.]
MHLIKNLAIGTRLALAFALLLALTATMATVGAFAVHRVHDSVQTIHDDRVVPLTQLRLVNRWMMRNRVLVMDMIAVPEPANIEKRQAELRDNVAKVGKTWDAYMATYLTPKETELAARFIAARKAYVEQGILPAADALRAGKVDEAQRIYRSAISPLAPATEQLMEQLSQLQADVAGEELQAATLMEERISLAMLVGTLAALALGGLLAWGITRSVTQPIARAVSLAQQVAAGDLSAHVVIDSRDETGQLLTALKAMNDHLAGIVGRVRQASDSIATGSSQIATGNADLSQRTEEQASNLQQTAASMEQLTATVKSNADTARQANQLASSASQAAAQGGSVVAQVVTTMGEISTSSRRIGEIIGTIDGIAFQTNILALNAAVEAARAGEQGRGFAVVAGEVRSLAQRAAEAAREIKTLIGSSVERVEAGTRLVGEAGQSMDGLVTQVRRVADLIADITAASTEQSQGIGQVGDAVAQLDQVTQQNAALVEESAAAAESLRLQASSLAELVGVFRLAPAGGAAA